MSLAIFSFIFAMWILILVGGGPNSDENKTVQDAVIIAHNVTNRKNPFYKNMPLTQYALDRPNRLQPILNQKPTTNLTNLKKQKGYLKDELESVAGKFTENFEEARTKLKDGTITDQLFNDPSDGSSDNNQSPVIVLARCRFHHKFTCDVSH